jgi:hypothetical protein
VRTGGARRQDIFQRSHGERGVPRARLFAASPLNTAAPAEAPTTEFVKRLRPLTSGNLLLVPSALFLLSRAGLLLLGLAGPRLLGTIQKHNAILLPRGDPLAGGRQWLAPWFRFDTGWYVGIAEHGYHYGRLGAANTNFLPLYPVLIRLVQPITLNSPWLAALAISNLSFFCALVLLWRWSLLRWDRHISLRVPLLVVAFPFAFFYFTPYAESLFLALAIGAFLAAEQKRWPVAVFLAGLSTIARPVGLAVVVGLVVIALQQGSGRRALLAGAAILPLLAFVAYLGFAFGHPTALLTYHSSGWVRPHGGVLQTVARQFHTHLSPFDHVDAAVSVIFLASVPLVWRRIGSAYALYVVVGLLLPLVHGLVSMERYVIVLFPVMAAWATSGGKVIRMATFGLSLFLAMMFGMMFASGVSIF